LDAAEIAVRMSYAAWKVNPTRLTKARHFHNVGRVATLRTQAERAAKITKAGTSGPRNPYKGDPA
jgi:hypothetical protein